MTFPKRTEALMSTRIFFIPTFLICLSLLLTTCGGGGGGGNGKRRVGVTPEIGDAEQIGVGYNHSCAVLKTGKVMCWGHNPYGVLGSGVEQTELVSSIVPVEALLGEGGRAKAVGVGDENTCVILEDGSLVCWGNNAYGQLGVGNTDNSVIPVPVDLGSDRSAKSIKAGFRQMCAVLDDGSLKCWGGNTYGQVGDGTTTDRYTPVSVNLGEGKKARAVSAGETHTCALLTEGSVLCWGHNGSGELGVGSGGNQVCRNETRDYDCIKTPTLVDLGSDRKARAVSVGVQKTCVLLEDGSILCWGRNDSGQLGVGSSSNEVCSRFGQDYDCVKTPTLVDLGNGRKALAVRTGWSHSCALLEDSSIVCWGSNHHGALGAGTTLDKNTPVPVDLGGRVVTDIHVGRNYACALLSRGMVTCWGTNGLGQLGNGQKDEILSPLAVDTGDETVTAMDGGIGYSCALFEDADSNVNLKCWGRNGDGQLGIGDNLERIRPVTVRTGGGTFGLGGRHACAIQSSDNSLRCWGYNKYGQLGTGDENNLTRPSTSVNLGNNKTATAVSAGGDHTCAILSDGTVLCWGRGSFGRLGNGDTANQNTPVPVSLGGKTAQQISLGLRHTCAILNDNKVYCWGENSSGALGIGSNTDQSTPSVVDLGTGKTATDVRAGRSHTCALLDDNSVKCWGSNIYGGLGDRSTTTRTSPVLVPLGKGRSARAIHAKGSHTCALLDDGSLLCWGLNDKGQLGDGTIANRNSPVAVDLPEGRTATALEGGGTHTCAFLDDQSIMCWGSNNAGEAGHPTAHRGDQPGEMGNNLLFVDFNPPKAAALPAFTLSMGQGHLCTIDEDGALGCWGRNDNGQLGLGDEDNRKRPVNVELGRSWSAVEVGLGINHSCAVLNNGSVVCWGDNSYGQLGVGTTTDHNTPTAVTFADGKKAEGVALGQDHTCALLTDGSVQCWGANFFNHLGVDSTNNDSCAVDGTNIACIKSPTAVNLGQNRTATGITAGNHHTCAILDDGSLKCWGYNSTGQLGDGTIVSNISADVDLGSGRTAMGIALGLAHTCALLDDGSVVCWGSNAHGQVGDGTDGTDRHNPTGVNLPADRTAVGLSAGENHTCAILDDDSLVCWGKNERGQVGDGTNAFKNAPTAVVLPKDRVPTALRAGGARTCAVLDDHSMMCWGSNYHGQMLDRTTIDRYRPVVVGGE